MDLPDTMSFTCTSQAKVMNSANYIQITSYQNMINQVNVRLNLPLAVNMLSS